MILAKPYDCIERLNAALAARKDRPFEWGRNDCGLFACDLLQAVSGIDFAAPFRGKYKSARGAARVLKRFAGLPASAKATAGLEAAVEKIAEARNREEVKPLMAQRGDLVLLDMPEGPALGVCLGAWVAAAGETGMVRVELREARRAWRI